MAPRGRDRVRRRGGPTWGDPEGGSVGRIGNVRPSDRAPDPRPRRIAGGRSPSVPWYGRRRAGAVRLRRRRSRRARGVAVARPPPERPSLGRVAPGRAALAGRGCGDGAEVAPQRGALYSRRMEDAVAAALIAPAIRRRTGTPGDAVARWADLGAGQGTFTRALARLLGPNARVAAVDREPRSLAVLATRVDAADTARPCPTTGARISVHEADFTDPAALDAVWSTLGWAALDGVLLANALHFVPAPAQAGVVAGLVSRLHPDGRLVIVEYEGRRPSRWVPAPVPFARLGELAAGLATVAGPVRVGTRPSAFGGSMYAAYVER